MGKIEWSSVALFAILFMLAGWILPDAYYRYVDDTEYWRVIGPVMIDKEYYAPCEEVEIQFIRESLIPLEGDLYITLYRVQNGNRFQVASRKVSGIVLEPGTSIVNTKYKLPCDLKPGRYMLERVMAYKVQGSQRFYTYNTPTFEVGGYSGR